jgi:pimeloyl-ACP methyl ester carboxylesterase
MFMPFQVLGMWIRGLISLAVFGAAIALLVLWYNNREHTVVERVVEGRPADVPIDDKLQVDTEPARHRTRIVQWHFGLNKETAYLLGGLAFLGLALGGGRAFSPWLWRRSGGRNDPQPENARQTEYVRCGDGRELAIASFGPADGDPIVCIHGWGLDSNEWFYAKRELGAYRIIIWDLPGLGRSPLPSNRDWSLERLAHDLNDVVACAGGKRVTLLGHSIGAMIILTYCKVFPEALGSRVGRLVLAHGTYTNPVRTSSNPRLHSALQKPVLEPSCHLMIWLSPLMRVLNWMSYLNGSAHRSTERDSFSGKETRGQLDFLTRFYCSAPPHVVARGMLAMFRYDATATLTRITIPTLIVAGDNDKSCTPEASRFMAERIPDAELVVLPDAKHCGLFEWHERFHEVVVRFLAESRDSLGRGVNASASAPAPPSSDGPIRVPGPSAGT